MVWRAPIVLTVKYREDNVKVWRCFCMEWNREFDMIIVYSVLKLNLGKNIIFEHDNNSKHTAHIGSKNKIGHYFHQI